MRVGHKFAIGEDAELSVDVSLSLATLFQSAHLAEPTGVEELSLTANQSKEQMLVSEAATVVEFPSVLAGKGCASLAGICDCRLRNSVLTCIDAGKAQEQAIRIARGCTRRRGIHRRAAA